MKSDIEITLGIASLLTVVIGGFIEVIQFVVEIVVSIIGVIKKVLQYIKKKKI